MSNKQYDLVIFIGRFEPPHLGHLQVINTALSLGKHVLVMCGSTGQPVTIKNPWTAQERVLMLSTAVSQMVNNPSLAANVSYIGLHDHLYNDQRWAMEVQSLVAEHCRVIGVHPNSAKIAIIGHSKDSSSYYLKMFPQWTQVEHSLNDNIGATDIRGLLFSNRVRFTQGVLHPSTYDTLVQFTQTCTYDRLKKEYEFIQQYKQSWAAAPYAPTFVTADAVVVQSGHVLLITRRSAPGKNLLALPGGFVNQSETVVEAAIRELREETKLKVPVPVLRGSIKYTKVFDHPDRSLRGRTITHASLIELPNGDLPQVKGGDDAARAAWVPLASIRTDNMFEDHYSIIEDMVGGLTN